MDTILLILLLFVCIGFGLFSFFSAGRSHLFADPLAVRPGRTF